MTDTLPLPLSDAAARLTALTDTRHGLLVEAGAGSGKTAILAGRVALLLANGAAARSIAAITFTELAAAELAGRVRLYVQELAEGVVPAPLAVAFGADGPTPEQRRCLTQALDELDDLTSTTIHGFARELTLPYPLEAGIDPGAVVMDAAEADRLFSDVFDDWLTRRLGREAVGSAEPLVTVLAHAKGPSLDDLRVLAEVVRDHPEVAAPEPDLLPALHGLLASARRVVEHAESLSTPPEKVASFLAALREYTTSLSNAGPACRQALAALEYESETLFTKTGSVRKIQAKGDWVAALAQQGVDRTAAAADYADFQSAHEEFSASWVRLVGVAVDHLLHVLVSELKDLIADYAAVKRARASVDFDDLIANAALLLRNERVRAELAERYLHVLVDEFQDTDPKQAELVWRLTGVPNGDDWRGWPARPGSRFVVGDPNQSIYRFRGADPLTYSELRARHIEDPGSLILHLTENFRSLPALIDNANLTFAVHLGAEGQAGYRPLGSRRAPGPTPPLLRLPVRVGGQDTRTAGQTDPAPEEPIPSQAEQETPYMHEARRAEAEAVALLCRQLVDGDESLLPGEVRPGDIALLAPGATGLEHYERALEAVGLDVASQAGKGFYRRQEVQDLVALACALADPHDTLALGALLRGPVVGITDEELLDVADGLKRAVGDARLTIATDPDAVVVPRVAEVLRSLKPLSDLRHSLPPRTLLSRAVDALRFRAVLASRHPGGPARALANLDLFLSSAGAYELAGLAEFAEDGWASWNEAEVALEGQVDAVEDAVRLITMHSAKGLEWRVVIPISSMSTPGRARRVSFSRSLGLPLMPLLGFQGSRAEEALRTERAMQDAERMRLWYVAATRARDLLVVPEYAFPTAQAAWCQLAEWQQEAPWSTVTPRSATAVSSVRGPHVTAQTRELFDSQARAVAAATRHLERRAPSRHEEVGVVNEAEEAEVPAQFSPEVAASILRTLSSSGPDDDVPPSEQEVNLGTLRGLLLHKLMEELVAGYLEADLSVLTDRAGLLAARLGVAEPLISPAHVAAMAQRAWSAPEVIALAADLVAEVGVAGSEALPAGAQEPEGAAVAGMGGPERRTVIWSGVADAVALSAEGAPYAVIDWKSDLSPTPETIARYESQVRAYLGLTGAEYGLLVFAARGEVVRVERAPAAVS